MDQKIINFHKCLICNCWTCHIGSLCEECYKNVTRRKYGNKQRDRSS